MHKYASITLLHLVIVTFQEIVWNSLIADDSQHEVPSFERHRAASTTVRLNVGGKVFHASWQLLLQVPESRLGEQTLQYPSSGVYNQSDLQGGLPNAVATSK